MTNIWFFIVPCLVMAFIGTKIKRRDAQIYEDWKFPWGPSTSAMLPGRIMFLIGTIGAVIGIYAAFKGPVNIGGLNLPQSRMLTDAVASLTDKKASMADKYSRKEKKSTKKEWASATEYAKKNISISGGWEVGGRSSYVYKGQVINSGDRKLRSVTFTLKGKNGDKQLGVNGIEPNSSKQYSFNLGKTFWGDYKGGPYLVKAVW